MVDFGKSDEVIKIIGKVDKLATGLVLIFRSLFKEELLQTKNYLNLSTF